MLRYKRQDFFLLNVVFVPLEINSVPYLDFTEYCYKECIVSDKDFIERIEKYFLNFNELKTQGTL